MGFAKYFEDNTEIADERVKDKQYKSHFLLVEEKYDLQKKRQKVYGQAPSIKKERITQKDSREDELRRIMLHIGHITQWRQFYAEISEDIESIDIKNYAAYRYDELESTLDHYQNEYFAAKYEHLRNKIKLEKNEDLQWIKIIEKDFAEIFISYIEELTNNNQKENIRFRTAYEDMEIYINKRFPDHQQKISQKGLIRTMIEDILERDIPMIECSHCHQMTYETFKICMHCYCGRKLKVEAENRKNKTHT